LPLYLSTPSKDSGTLYSNRNVTRLYLDDEEEESICDTREVIVVEVELLTSLLSSP